MTRFAYEEALDCMVAYYKVALKRFVDDIATQAVKVKLLGAFPTLFTPMSVFGMSKDLVTQIAGESDESRCLRQQLNKKSWILTTGSDSNNEMRSRLPASLVISYYGSCCSIEPHEEADAIEIKTNNAASRSSSPDLPEQTTIDDCVSDYITGTVELPLAPTVTNVARKKKRGRAFHKTRAPIEPAGDTSVE